MLANALLEKHGTYIFISSKGREILKDFERLLIKNNTVLKYVDQAVNELAPLSGRLLKRITYDTALRTKRLIRYTKPSEQLLGKIDAEKARSWFLIDEASEETLSFLMDKKACKALEQGIADARAGRFQRYRPLG